MGHQSDIRVSAGKGRCFVPCPDGCEARFQAQDQSGPPRAAKPCPVLEARGRWGWPCHRPVSEWIDNLEDQG